jgi:hypothetical protein
MGTQTFQPMGASVSFVAAASAPSPVQAPGRNQGACAVYRVLNEGSVYVSLNVGATSAGATAGAAVSGMRLAPGVAETFTLTADAWFTGTTAAGTATVSIIPGDGV